MHVNDRTMNATMPGIINGKPISAIAVTTQQDMVDVTTQFEPDPSWTYVDRKGHFHAYTGDDNTSHYPTLKTRHVHTECSLGGTDGGCPDHNECDGDWESSLVCVICEQEVTPGSRTTVGRSFIPGLQSWSVEAAGVWAESGDVVSVRLNDSRGLPLYFGVAQCSDMRYGSSDTVYTARFEGIGPLARVGKKKVC